MKVGAKKPENQTPRLTGDVETLCAILARIVARIATQPLPRPKRSKAWR